MVSTRAGDVAIARASAKDHDALVHLLAACGLAADDVSGDLEAFVLARTADKVIGSCGLEVLDRWGLLRSLAVTPEYRGRGIAGELAGRCLRQARELHLEAVYLLTTSAEPLFARWGFVKVNRDTAPQPLRDTAQFRTLCPASAVTMRLSLT